MAGGGDDATPPAGLRGAEAAEFMSRHDPREPLGGPTQRSVKAKMREGSPEDADLEAQMLTSASMKRRVQIDDHFDISKVRKIQISWRQLQYSVPLGGGCFKSPVTKTILKDVSGRATAGHLMAIMGPTGCGKSSLLNTLAGRLPKNGLLEGEILVNDQTRDESFNHLSAYSLQDDNLFANLTVRETFKVAADLRLPRGTSKQTKQQVVEAVITAMSLSKAADTYIGNAMVRGVSGGERKRTNIAVELISNPSIIFLDEPTSGLDSFQAQSVMEALLNLARGGRTVISVIHQPRSSIFQMFDQLCLLSEGRTMYLGDAHSAVDFFTTMGFPCPTHFNAADFFLDLVSMDYRSPEAEKSSQQRIEALANHSNSNNPMLQATQSSSEDIKLLEKPARAQTAGFFRQLSILAWRASVQNNRNKLPNIIAVFQAIFIGVLIGLIYSDLDKTQMGINDRLGVFFFITINSCMGSMFSVMQAFPAEKSIVNRERDAKAYTVLPYFISKVICEVPYKCIPQILNGIIIYWMVGLNPDPAAFGMFLLTQCLLAFSATSLGLMTGCWCPTQEITFAVSPMIMIVLMLFGGFYISIESLPPGSFWVAYISPMNWGFMSFCINDLKGEAGWRCNTACVSSDSPFPENAPPDACRAEETLVELTRCLKTGNEILDLRLGYGEYTVWEANLYLLLGALGFLLVGYIGLVVTKKRYQPLTKIGIRIDKNNKVAASP